VKNLNQVVDRALPAALSVGDLTVAYQSNPVVEDVSFDLPTGCLAAMVGPNGAGKSTVLKACLNLLPKISGQIQIYGEAFSKKRPQVAYVPQRESVDWDFPVNVLDVVAMGAYRTLGWFRRVNSQTKQAALEALERVGMAEFADRQISQLSGGQQQRVFLARALVQEADLFFLDEPFAAVDAATEQAVVELLRDLRKRGATCLVVHHDLATVPQYFDWVVLLNKRVTVCGPTEEAFTKANVCETYGGNIAFLGEASEAFGRDV
jgi:manganese/zinc/iron transport system ATP- binding protein